MRVLDWRMVKKFKIMWNEAVAMVNTKFKNHYQDYNESIERDFCDALISSKNDALKDGKDMAIHLTDANLSIITLDVLFAGTDTVMHTFEWCLLFLAYYPEVQKKLREEVEGQIGSRIPILEDRNHCHYVMSFISEILRFRNNILGGLPHSTLVSSKLNQFLIPADTTVMVYQGGILTDEKYWQNGDQFIPERFLENGSYMSSLPKAYIPFSIGRRACPGKKIALAELFFVLVRFLQSTADYDIILGTNNGIEPESNVVFFNLCHAYKIILKTKQV